MFLQWPLSRPLRGHCAATARPLYGRSAPPTTLHPPGFPATISASTSTSAATTTTVTITTTNNNNNNINNNSNNNNNNNNNNKVKPRILELPSGLPWPLFPNRMCQGLSNLPSQPVLGCFHFCNLCVHKGHLGL